MFEIINIDELLKRLDRYNHKELHVHHTWSPSHKDFNGNNGLELQQAMRNYHVNTKGWNDIGQHVTLLPNGLFVTGRDFAKTPASIQGYNTGGFACEMLGNFDTGNDKFEGAQKDSMLRLAKYFDDKGRYVRFHRENAPKTCPGTSIDKTVFMNEVKALGKTQSAPPVKSTPQTKGKDAEVVALQDKLNKLKITDEKGNKLAEDGSYGPLTKTAVKRFQNVMGIKVDGNAGPNTNAELNKILDKPVTQQGAKGDVVRYIQWRVGAAIDGSFGPKTLLAIKTWQKKNGLDPDGSVGPKTWAKLIG